MRYVITKYVDADSAEQALMKSRKLPPHEIYIHNDSWKETGYQIGKEAIKKLGFTDDKKKD